MKKLSIPAELNSQLIYLRNRELYSHFNRINQIKARKNIYKFKKIDICKPKNPLSSSSESQLKIKRDNLIMATRLDGIDRRKNKILADDMTVKFYIDLFSKNSNTVKKRLANELTEANHIYKQRLKSQRPVIDDKKLKEQFDTNRIHYNIMRKIKPSSSCGNIYITPAESARIREYQKLTLNVKGNHNNWNNRHSLNNSCNLISEKINDKSTYNSINGTMRPRKLPKIKFWYLISGLSNS